MIYETIEVSREGSVGLIRKNRPEKLNAWTRRMAAEERAAISAFNEDSDIGAIVLSGNGRAVCAGLDLQQQQADVNSARLRAKPATHQMSTTKPGSTSASPASR